MMNPLQIGRIFHGTSAGQSFGRSSMMRTIRAPALLLLLLPITSPRAMGETWLLTTIDFKTERAEISSIDERGIQISGGSEPRVVPFAQVLQIERPAAQAARGRLSLRTTGGEIYSGEPAGVSDERLRWTNAVLGEIVVPLKSVRSISSSTLPSARDGELKEASVEDVVRLVNGDSLRGILTDVSARNVVIQPTGADPATVPLDSVSTIELAAAPGAATQAAAELGFRVNLLDGSIATVPSITLAGDEVHFQLLEQPRTLRVVSIRSIEQVNGPVVWLSSVEPTENIQTPFLGPSAVAKMNASVRGAPITFGTRTYTNGIGVHSFSRLTWAVDENFKTFRTQYALDGDVPYANVTVRILLDNATAHEARNVTAGTLSPVISLDLAAVKSITLEVDYGENYDVQDRLNWIEPAFLTGIK